MYIVVKEEYLEFILLSLQNHSIINLENLNIFHWLSKTRLGNWLELKILLRIFSLKQIYPRNNNLMKSSMIALLHSKYLVSVCSLNSTVQTDFFLPDIVHNIHFIYLLFLSQDYRQVALIYLNILVTANLILTLCFYLSWRKSRLQILSIHLL